MKLRLNSITAKTLVGATAAIAVAVVGGCMNTAYQVIKNKNTPGLKDTIDSIPKQTVTLKGKFTQSLEQSEFNDGKTKYHVFDPQGLLAKYAENHGQKGVAKSFDICIEGRVSEKGSYGHLGKYPYELWVDKLCE